MIATQNTLWLPPWFRAPLLFAKKPVLGPTGKPLRIRNSADKLVPALAEEGQVCACCEEEISCPGECVDLLESAIGVAGAWMGDQCTACDEDPGSGCDAPIATITPPTGYVCMEEISASEGRAWRVVLATIAQCSGGDLAIHVCASPNSYCETRIYEVSITVQCVEAGTKLRFTPSFHHRNDFTQFGNCDLFSSCFTNPYLNTAFGGIGSCDVPWEDLCTGDFSDPDDCIGEDTDCCGNSFSVKSSYALIF